MIKVADQARFGIGHDTTLTPTTQQTATATATDRHVAGQLRQLFIPAALLPATTAIPGGSSPVLPTTARPGWILWRLAAKSRWECYATGLNLYPADSIIWRKHPDSWRVDLCLWNGWFRRRATSVGGCVYYAHLLLPFISPYVSELGINFSHIRSKSLAVLNPFERIDARIIDDADLAGPLIFFLCFATFLLFVRVFGLLGCTFSNLSRPVRKTPIQLHLWCCALGLRVDLYPPELDG